MRSFKVFTSVLLLAIIICAFYIQDVRINANIEKTINENYKNELDELKSKLMQQSELINSIVNLRDKDEANSTVSNTDIITNESNESQVEFSYIKENGGITITKYNGKQTSVQIPNYIEGLPVLKIGQNAFSETKVKSVSVPDSCIEIDWFSFYGCYALTTVYLAKSVTAIGYGAFDSCSSGLKIYCERDSYAELYAKSFGLSYTYFK